ncbi:MAG: polymerase sigma-70 factor, subfamily [Actinomycetota bacterium]|nr:polymerase sigma-70 factor, subfamily [Actinomycetota bacterium]
MRAGSNASHATPEPDDDREMVLAFQAGDELVYEQIYLRHADRVRHICRRILGNGQDAEEAAQESFLRAYVGLGRFNGQYQLGAWLARIAANVCFDQLRLRGRTVQTTELGDDANAVVAIKGLEKTVEEQMAIGETMKEMPPLHRKALFLRAVEGLSHNEIADHLDMSSPQVKALLHRARASFKKVWSSASGWSVAFLLSIRGRVDGRLRQVGVGAAEVATSAGPHFTMVAERVATSAVVVALVLSGSTGAPTGLPHRAGPRPYRAAEDPHHRSRQGGAQMTLPDVATTHRIPSPARAGRGRAGPADLVASLNLPIELPQEARGRKQEKRRHKGSGDPEEDQDPVPAPARPVVREVEKVLEDIPPS